MACKATVIRSCTKLRDQFAELGTNLVMGVRIEATVSRRLSEARQRIDMVL